MSAVASFLAWRELAVDLPSDAWEPMPIPATCAGASSGTPSLILSARPYPRDRLQLVVVRGRKWLRLSVKHEEEERDCGEGLQASVRHP